MNKELSGFCLFQDTPGPVQINLAIFDPQTSGALLVDFLSMDN